MSTAVGMPDADTLRTAAPRLSAGARFLVCYSGGADSSALLHALKQARLEPLEALHVNHGLQRQADTWSNSCSAQCAALGVPLQVLRVEVEAAHRHGPEAAARAARYDALSNAMQPGDVLVLAHHRDDQAETVLLRLLRGSGVDGLAAMREQRAFGPGRLWRPFLNVPRAALRAYAEQHDLNWIEDPHNTDQRYTRVWLRQAVLPLLASRVPGAAQTLARSAAHAAEQSELLEQLALMDLSGLERSGGALDIPGLLRLTAARQRNALRCWLWRLGFVMPSTEAMYRLQQEILPAPVDARPLLRCGDYELRRYRSMLYAMAVLPPAPDGDTRFIWHQSAKLELPAGCGSLNAARPPPRPLTVCFCKGGERLRPATASHTRTLKNLFQEAAIPPWQRARTPLIELDGVLAWVPGLAETLAWQQFSAEQSWQPHLMSSIPRLAPI